MRLSAALVSVDTRSRKGPMRFHTPIFELPGEPPSTATAAGIDKLGGQPDGIDPNAWPSCGECKRPLSFIGQFHHHTDRLDLGGDDRVLTLWHCSQEGGSECEVWDPDAGTHRAIVSEATETRSPVPTPSSEIDVFSELPVVEWVEADDGVNEADYPDYFVDAKYHALTHPENAYGTKLGGVPMWLQNAAEGPTAPWRFVMQLEEKQDIRGVEPRGSVNLATPNFAMGRAFVFVNTESRPAEGHLFFQT